MRVLYASVVPQAPYPDGTYQPPHADPWPQARAAVRRYAPQAEEAEIAQANWRGYWDAMTARWGEEDLMLVEQDNILHARAVPELESCPEPWCLFPYFHPGEGALIKRSLGCTRFRTAFQHAVTLAALAAVPGSCCRCGGSPDSYKCWAHLDGRITQVTEELGLFPHVHSPAVGHRDVPPEGEI
jgi:hypothetical protein